MLDMPIVTLKNGLRVGNFSSPHPFTFDDGTVLPACSVERTKRGALEAIETEEQDARLPIRNIKIEFALTDGVRDMLGEAIKTEVDIVLVPLPVKTALCGHNGSLAKTPFRVVRVKDRVTKVLYSDKFCV